MANVSDTSMYEILRYIKKMIKNTEVLTQAEYDSLVADGKVKEGIFYVIVDE